MSIQLSKVKKTRFFKIGNYIFVCDFWLQLWSAMQ